MHVEAEWDVDDEVGETGWLAGIRAACGRPTVAVAHARLERDGVEDVLAEHGLSYDLQAPFELLPEAAHLARDFPGTTIVVNHTGLPVDRSEVGLKAWRQALETVAAWPNVALKISGLGTRDKTWPHDANRHVVREAIAAFGAARCMFASNYPVDSLCARFDTIYGAFADVVSDRAPAERRALFADNARRIYRIA